MFRVVVVMQHRDLTFQEASKKAQLLAGTWTRGDQSKPKNLQSADLNGHVELSAFKIPYGTAFYTPPFVVHCDAFLVGKYTVAYTATPNFQTALLMTPKPKDKRASLQARNKVRMRALCGDGEGSVRACVRYVRACI